MDASARRLILVVEDEADLAATCERLLRRRRHAVVAVGSRAAALASLEHASLARVVSTCDCPTATASTSCERRQRCSRARPWAGSHDIGPMLNGRRVSALVALVAAHLAAVVAPVWAQNAALAEQGRRAFVNQGCHGCHKIGAMGTPIGPDLSHVGAKYRADYLARWLRDPSYLRPSTHMPTIELSDDDIRSIAAFLAERQ